MINQIEGSGFTQTFKDNNEDIPCSDYYYYKPHTEGNNGWDAETEGRGEAPSGFYALERATNGRTDEQASQWCTNSSVRLNNSSINSVACADQSTKILTDPGRLNTPGAVGSWSSENGLDISANEAIVHGLGMTPSVEENQVDGQGEDQGDGNDVTGASLKTLNPEGNLKTDGTWYIPLDGIEGEGQTSNTWQECQQRCLDTEGCVYFNSFAGNACHITDGRDGTSMGEYRQDLIDADPTVAGTNGTIKSGRAAAPNTGECNPSNTGIANRVKGSFNAICRENNQEKDYCRFIGDTTDPYGIWLSCVSPENDCSEDPLPNSRYAWGVNEIPEAISSVFNDESEEVQREASLKNFFSNECSLKVKCPSAEGLPDNPSSSITGGEAGYSDRARGFFDASCNGEENDYCRFVGSSSNPRLSCWSPSNENGCENKWPDTNEELGWSIDHVDTAASSRSSNPSELSEANSALRAFFENNCNRSPCSGGLNPDGGCETLNVSPESKAMCNNGEVFENVDGLYKQCYLDAEDNTCKSSETTCTV